MNKCIFLVLFATLWISACSSNPGTASTPAASASQLIIADYPLEKIPDPESPDLETVLDAVRLDPRFQHEEEVSRVVEIPFCTVAEHQGICIMLGSDRLFAVEEYDSAGNGKVTVTRNGSEIYSLPVGKASPLTNLRGLWAYGGHWVLETVRVNSRQDGNQVPLETIGQITRDGLLLNDINAYDEAYEFQILDGRPFYLFRRGTNIDASFDGNEVPLGYTQIIHYGCCSESNLNPVHHLTYLDFFARKGEDWYYIEIGSNH